jgi:uncharacterized protein DUF4384
MVRARTFRRAAVAWIGLAVMALPALAQDDTRAVRIIEGAPGQPVTPASPPPMGNIDIRQTAIRADNPAGLELAILPDLELAAGTRVTLRVATRKQGYLVLVDVDPTGKLTQIFPNRHTLERRDNPEMLNLIKPGQPVTIPNQHNPYAGFEFVASPPAGVAMLVAILSDKPVHILDLPDISPPQAGQAAFDQLLQVARGLRIAREDGNQALEEPIWSFAAKLYFVK